MIIQPIYRVHSGLASVVGAPPCSATNGSPRTHEDDPAPFWAVSERRNSCFQCSDERVHVDLEMSPPCIQRRIGRSNSRQGLHGASVQYQTIQVTVLGQHRLDGRGECGLVGSVRVISEGFGSEHPKCDWHVALDHLQGLGVRRSQSI